MIDRRLQTLRAIHHYGTVTAAAQALHLTPSAVSQQVRGLSAELGVALMEPQGRKVRLTDGALMLISHADALFVRWEEARADLAERTEGVTGPLRISGFPSALATLVAPAAARLRRTCPDLSVQVAEVETSQGFDLLLSGEVDVAVVTPTASSPPLDDPRFEQELLLDQPQDLLVPIDHDLTKRESVMLSDAACEPWIVPAPGSCDQHELVFFACASAGFTPTVAHQAKEWAAIAALVAQGLGVALVPRLAQLLPQEPVARLPLTGQPTPMRRILACVRRGSRDHPAIRQGLDALRSVRMDVPPT